MVQFAIQEARSVTFKFSPFLLGLVLLGGIGSVLQAAFGDSSVFVRVLIWVVLLVSTAWLAWLLTQAVRTGVAALPVFVWYLNIDRRSSSFLYIWAVLTYGAGLFGALVMTVILVGIRF